MRDRRTASQPHPTAGEQSGRPAACGAPLLAPGRSLPTMDREAQRRPSFRPQRAH